MEGEPFHEAWERFKLFLVQSPNHRYPLELLNQFFYDGLTQACQAMVDNAAMGEKIVQETNELYEMLGANSQQKSVRGKSRGMYEVNTNTKLAMQVSELTKQMKTMCNMMMGQGLRNSNEVYASCGIVGPATNVCPSRGNFPEFVKQASMMNSYNPRPHDSYPNTYNLGWRNHPNFSWRNNQQQVSSNNQSQNPSLEETLNNFIQVSQQNQQNFEQRFQQQKASIRKLEVQIGQITEAVQGHVSGKLPSQLEQAKAVIVLQSGKNEEINSIVAPPKPYVPPIPFPSRLKNSKWDKSFSKIYDILSKVNVNLPLLDVIRTMPAYTKFLNDLITHKRKFEPNEKVMVPEKVSVLLQRNLPPKLKDPGFRIDQANENYVQHVMGQGLRNSNEVCASCGIVGPTTNVCLSRGNFLEFVEQANMMNSYNPRPHDPYSNTYNLGWRNHPNFSWRNNQQQGSSNKQSRKPSLEETLNNFIQVSQ
ncbi:uncharacterized protein LOC116118405 [Pistacia vera]|uniref:uncharacterized protein LOC116118405 n=1 Tax=Pistacia vera TaxID=55513 RepID=UPI0012635A64|nr:uncharacterized protein LOC116118405 [Pistacia vera]